MIIAKDKDALINLIYAVKDLNSIDTSAIVDMCRLFFNASSFNQHLNDLGVSKVRDMSEMFYLASSFNQPLNNWDVSKVEDIRYMFLCRQCIVAQ